MQPTWAENFRHRSAPPRAWLGLHPFPQPCTAMPNSPNPHCFRGRSSKPAHLESQAIRSKRRPPTHCPGPKRLVSTRPPTPTHPASTKQLVLCATSPGWGKAVAPSNNWSLEQPSHRLPTLGSPIPWQRIVHILTTLQHIATTNHQQLPPIEASLPERLTRAGSREPSATLVHLSWVLDQVIQPDGYIPATAQETLLQAYLGERGASATATLAQPSPATTPSIPSAMRPTTARQSPVAATQAATTPRPAPPVTLAQTKPKTPTKPFPRMPPTLGRYTPIITRSHTTPPQVQNRRTAAATSKHSGQTTAYAQHCPAWTTSTSQPRCKPDAPSSKPLHNSSGVGSAKPSHWPSNASPPLPMMPMPSEHGSCGSCCLVCFSTASRGRAPSPRPIGGIASNNSSRAIGSSSSNRRTTPTPPATTQTTRMTTTPTPPATTQTTHVTIQPGQIKPDEPSEHDT